MRRCRASPPGRGGCPLHDVCRRTAAALLRPAMLPSNPVVDCIVEELQYGRSCICSCCVEVRALAILVSAARCSTIDAFSGFLCRTEVRQEVRVMVVGTLQSLAVKPNFVASIFQRPCSLCSGFLKRDLPSRLRQFDGSSRIFQYLTV